MFLEVPALRNSKIFGRVAQLGERLVRNEEVVGSIPITSTILNTTLRRGFLFAKRRGNASEGAFLRHILCFVFCWGC